MRILLVCVCSLVLLFSYSYAEDGSHTTPIRHNCVKPVHPRLSNTGSASAPQTSIPQDGDFVTQVERYKFCILKFSAEQKKAEQMHALAIENATDEWYAFIRESIASGALYER